MQRGVSPTSVWITLIKHDQVFIILQPERIERQTLSKVKTLCKLNCHKSTTGQKSWLEFKLYDFYILKVFGGTFQSKCVKTYFGRMAFMLHSPNYLSLKLFG